MVFARPDGASGGASAQTPAEIPRKYWRGDLLWALLGAGVVLLMRWPFLHLPLINNEGELANTARLLHRGSLLYRDHYANHTPLAYYWFLPLAWMKNPDPEVALRLLHLAALPFLFAVMAPLARRFALPAWLVILCAAVLLGLPVYDSLYAGTEPLSMIGSAAMMLAALGGRAGWMGAAWGMLALNKQTALGDFPTALYGLWRSRPRGRALALLALFTALPLGLWMLWCLSRGSFPDFWQQAIADLVHYSGYPDRAYQSSVPLFLGQGLHWVWPLAPAALYGMVCLNTSLRGALAVFGTSVALEIFLPGRHYAEYFQLLWPPAALALAAGLLGLWRLALTRRIVWLYAAAALLHFAGLMHNRWVNSRAQAPYNHYDRIRAAGRLIADHPEWGTLFMYGNEPELFTYAGRLPLQKVSWNQAFFINRDAPYYQREQRIQFRQFSCTAPAVMAVVLTSTRYHETWKTQEMLALDSAAWADMTLAAVVGGEPGTEVRIYRRTAPPSGCRPAAAASGPAAAQDEASRP